MNKILISSLLICFFLTGTDEFVSTASAQTVAKRVERRVDRRVDRRFDRRVERRVHRRVSRRAHVRYAGLPVYRSTVTVLPSGAVHVKVRGNAYHYHNGIYYHAHGKSFTVVRPVAGVRVRVLPARAIALSHMGIRYHYYYGAFYVQKGDEYEVVDAPAGAVVDALPEGYTVKVIDDVEYYELDGVTYREVDAEEFEDGVGFEVI
ncbi:DUF6515 family protein [Fulvivirga sedimenti]|uniref:DUF6515 family protein n=1 Tax=Fulvivirga sedimenti TaxID=2879465 RepID=A0A9X1HNH0_9BACT|nr:DUF6515 family protein [Fulvivirga sedimenti]MCA6074048.1 DUF6515 family protein [Fulvivirga sedimenti]